MNPKKLLLLFSLLLPLAAFALQPAQKVIPKAQLDALVTEFRRCDGVETVRLGRVATLAAKGVVRMAAKGDPDAREMMDILRGIRRLTVLQYDDAAPEVRERINARLTQVLDGSELLMEARDGSSSMRIFGVVDDAGDTVRDFVIHAPGDNALICIFGSLSMDSLGKMMAND